MNSGLFLEYSCTSGLISKYKLQRKMKAGYGFPGQESLHVGNLCLPDVLQRCQVKLQPQTSLGLRQIKSLLPSARSKAS